MRDFEEARAIWNELSYTDYKKLVAEYLKAEHANITEESFLKGHIEDGMTEDDAQQHLTDNVFDYYFEKGAKTMNMKNEVLKRLENEDFESLTKRGRGVHLEQLCVWAGLSEYGTSKDKANRLLEWKEKKELTQ